MCAEGPCKPLSLSSFGNPLSGGIRALSAAAVSLRAMKDFKDEPTSLSLADSRCHHRQHVAAAAAAVASVRNWIQPLPYTPSVTAVTGNFCNTADRTNTPG